MVSSARSRPLLMMPTRWHVRSISERMCDEMKIGLALLVLLQQDVPHFFDAVGIEGGDGLVEDEDLRDRAGGRGPAESFCFIPLE